MGYVSVFRRECKEGYKHSYCFGERTNNIQKKLKHLKMLRYQLESICDLKLIMGKETEASLCFPKWTWHASLSPCQPYRYFWGFVFFFFTVHKARIVLFQKQNILRETIHKNPSPLLNSKYPVWHKIHKARHWPVESVPEKTGLFIISSDSSETDT